jgi:hypothetical protein
LKSLLNIVPKQSFYKGKSLYNYNSSINPYMMWGATSSSSGAGQTQTYTNPNYDTSNAFTNNGPYTGTSQYAYFSPSSQLGIGNTPSQGYPSSLSTSAYAPNTANSSLQNSLSTIISILMQLIQTMSSNSSTANNTPAFDQGGNSGNGGNGYHGHGSPSPSTPSPTTPSPTTPSPTTPSPGDNGNVSTGTVDGGGPNELVLKNTDSKPMTIALFENTGPGMNPNLDDPNNKFTVQPGQTLKLSMPESWQGRAQKLSGNPTDPATWAEINFEKGQNGGKGKIWYDESLIRGYNSAVTMKPTNATDDSELAGSSQSILAGAPSDATTTDAGGNKVIKDTEGFDGGINQSAIDYFNSSVGNTHAYVRNWDNGAVRTTDDNSLTVTFGAA